MGLQRQARPACPGADPGSGFVRSGGEGGGEGAEAAQLERGGNRLPWPRDRRDAGVARHSHDGRQLDLGGSGRRRRGACDSGRMVERRLQRAALLFPAVPRPLALYRLGDAVVADRLARAQAGRDPSGRQGRPRLSRRISERLFDVRVRHERRHGDHRRQARVRSQHFLGHLRLHHHRLACDRVRVFRLSAAGVLEAAFGAQGEIGPGARRPGDALPPRGRARPDRPQPRRRRRRGNRGSSRFRIRRRNSPPRANFRSFS